MRNSLGSGLIVVVALAAPLIAASAPAQCVGDCDGSDTVTVNEIVTGAAIALGTEDVGQCPEFDADHSGTVTVNELIVAVNNALSGCPVTTATPAPSPVPTATPLASCGNGVVDFNLGETCDDGNRLDGDSCPANCHIASCSGTDETVTATVLVTPPAGVDLAGLTLFIRYPDGVVQIPGMANDQQVSDHILDLPGNAFATPNDLDYGLRLVILTPDQSALPGGPLFSILFTRCAGAAVPSATQFTCRIEDAADTALNTITDATCAVTLP